MNNFTKIHEQVKKALEERKEKLKENPRYDIDSLANKNGELRIYFASSHEYQLFEDGKASRGSTERFFDDDIFCNVPKERIEKITDGGTIAYIMAVENNE